MRSNRGTTTTTTAAIIIIITIIIMMGFIVRLSQAEHRCITKVNKIKIKKTQ